MRVQKFLFKSTYNTRLWYLRVNEKVTEVSRKGY